MSGYEGRRLGSYQLLHLMGQGGYAQVYLGLHVHLATPAAIKVLHGPLTAQHQALFLEEARIIARLDHQHIVRVLDFGIEQDCPFLVMDYAAKGSMASQYPRGAPMALERLLTFMKQVAEALQYAHDRNVVHRDVKPDNLLLKRSNHLLLSDFGIAVTLEGAPPRESTIVGTIDYAAPEQLRGYPCAASDQYALGVVAYEWLTGNPPFRGTTAQLLEQHQEAEPPPLRGKVPAIPPGIEQVVLRALAKDPAARWPSVRAFADALREAAFAAGPPSSQLAMPAVPLPPGAARRPEEPAGLPWNIPFRRNPFFTGREEVLSHLHRALSAEAVAALTQPRAISGLGGVGKTQTAVEYAHRYRDSFQAVLWARAETPEALQADFVAIAAVLNLPEKDDPDPGRVAPAVRQWLQSHGGWLLILDNVEDLPALADFLPSRGSILLTTRSQITAGTASRIDLDEMSPEEGALFLARRAGMVDPALPYGALADALRAEAREIAELLDGLPLALDQAGAYIEETKCTLFDYLDLYRSRRGEFLERRGGLPSPDHPEPVATTWSLSFERVERSNRAAADLLRFCAFLAPDAIPEEVVREGLRDLGPALARLSVDQLELDDALRELRKYSLIRRDHETRTLSVHRLVQAVLRDSMDDLEQRFWVERTVVAVNGVFPDGEDAAGWSECERLLPQVYASAAMIDERSLVTPEAARLLNQAGLYLLELAQYSVAELFLKKALAIRSLLLGGGHSAAREIDVAECLNDLGTVYMLQQEYARTEPLLSRALAIYERVLGPEHPDVAVATNNVAMLAYYQRKYAEAEPLFQRALAMWRRTPGATRAGDVARTTNNLALLYFAQRRYAEAEPLYREALATWERILGPEHPDVARTLNNQAKLYCEQGRYAEAEPLFHRARAIREKMLGPDHPDVAQTLTDLGKLYADQGRYAEAEPLYQLALEIREQMLGADHPSVAEALRNYAFLLSQTRRPEEATRMEARARSIESMGART